MLTERQQFQAAFLCKAAMHGLTPAEAADAADRLADLVESRAKAAASGILDVPKQLLGGAVNVSAKGMEKLFDTTKAIGLPLMIGGPFVGGLTAGLGYRKATDIEDDDVEVAKIRELTATYQQLAQQARRRELL